MTSVKSYEESEMEGEPANEEKPSDEEWPLEKAEVGILYRSSWIYAEFAMLHTLQLGTLSLSYACTC